MFLYITSVAILIVPVLSRYTCPYDEGTCTPLSECLPLVEEIKRAGNPMPTFMWKKLEKLGCGFNNKEPWVCCLSSDNSKTNVRSTSDPNANWITVTKRPNSNQISTGTRDGSDGPEDVSNHPNLSLLPVKDCGTIDTNRIIGGNRTALYEMPWMVVLSYDSDGETKLSCGGTLINERYVLTAAHCVQLGKLTLNGAILGEHDMRTDPDCEILAGNMSCAPGTVNASIEEVISHPGYNKQTLFDDIALIRLAEPANFKLDNIGPICLPITPSLQNDDLNDLMGIVAGWGITEERIQSPVLLSVPLPIIDNESCQLAYKGVPRLYNKQMCAGGGVDKDSCSGDSGGPLMYPGIISTGGIRHVQRGIVSFGPKRCGIGGVPGVYTKTAYYMKWILDNMRR